MDIFFDNEFRNLIPPLQPDEREHLETSLKAEGNRDPIIIWKETQLLLDGHNRYDICTNAGIPLKPALQLSFPDRNAAIVWIIQNQFGRRNLSRYSRSVLALRLEEILRPKAKENLRTSTGRSNIFNIGRIIPTPILTPVKKSQRPQTFPNDTIAKVKVIEASATPEQKEQLANGTKTINQVFVAVRRDEIKEHSKEYRLSRTGIYRSNLR